MAAVAERAGIAKGTLFLYFPAKDVLSLALIERLLGDWLDALDARLGAPRPPTAPGELAEAVAESLGARHLLPLLLGRLAQVRDAAPEHAAAVQQAIGARLDRTGALVESRLSFMKRGDGRRFAGFVLTQLAGLQHVSGTLTGDAEAGIEPHASLRRTVRLYLRGLKAKRAD